MKSGRNGERHQYRRIKMTKSTKWRNSENRHSVEQVCICRLFVIPCDVLWAIDTTNTIPLLAHRGVREISSYIVTMLRIGSSMRKRIAQRAAR